MPKLTGLQVLAALRKNQINTPVIFMTMHGSEHIAAEVFRLGVRDYISKPFTIDEIKTAVDKALHEERLSREKELLSKQLVAADSVRQTVITLSHYINNGLAVVQGGLEEIQDDVNKGAVNTEQWAQILADSQGSVKKIKAVLKVLQQVTNVIGTNYLGNITMVDIEAALKAEIEKTAKTG
jgi:YesN/AraC family two-component response regulator